MGLSWLLIAAVSAVPAPPTARPEPAPQSAAEDDQIIVTGERVKRTIRDTASSVSIITRREIEAASADRVEQMLALVPNVQLGSGSEGPAIRGQDTTGALQALPAFLGGNRPRTTLVVDGRPVSYYEFVFGAEPAWDVDRIEVFRSPQTTTQGQNSIAGAIFVTTEDPKFAPEARARLIGGSLKMRQVSAMATGPLIGDQLALRVAGDLRYSRTSSDIVDRNVGADPNHDVYGLLRVKLLAEPRALPGTRILLTYAHLKSQAPQIVGLTRPFEARRDSIGGYGVFRIDSDSITASARNEPAPGLTFDAVATGGDSHSQRLAPQGAGQADIRARDWSGEAVVHWTPERPFRLTGGVSHTHNKLNQVIDLSILSGIGRFHDVQDGTGVFGEADWTLAQRLTLTTGLRYQRDRQQRSGGLATRTGALIALNYDQMFEVWLPKISLAYDFTDVVRAGVLLQRAYNPGGTTLRFDTGTADEFGAETLWDSELFARARLDGGRLIATANLFHYAMRNAQRSATIIIRAPNGFPVGFADLFNVPRARAMGAEASLDWRATPRLTARLAVGLLATKITQTNAAHPELAGSEAPRAPHFSGSASIDWRPVERLRLSGSVRHHSRYFSDNLNSRSRRIGSGTIIDARAEYNAGRATLFGYARNLFDRFSLLEMFDPQSATAEEPREIGIGIEARF